MKYLYEQDYIFTGWADEGGGGLTLFSWYDRDLAGGRITDNVIPLYALETVFFIDGNDVFFQVPPITVEILPGLFIDEDVFYQPMSVRALTQPAQMLRNEIRRVR